MIGSIFWLALIFAFVLAARVAILLILRRDEYEDSATPRRHEGSQVISNWSSTPKNADAEAQERESA